MVKMLSSSSCQRDGCNGRLFPWAVLSDGARIRVIEDRGWSAGLHGSIPEAADIRSLTSVEDIERMARVVVGADEPVDGLKSRSGL
jgi:hypothetical protein